MEQKINFRNIYAEERCNLIKLSREEAEKLLSNGIEVGYTNIFPFYHGSNASEYGWNRSISIKQLEDHYKSIDSLLTKITVHPNVLLII